MDTFGIVMATLIGLIGLSLIIYITYPLIKYHKEDSGD